MKSLLVLGLILGLTMPALAAKKKEKVAAEASTDSKSKQKTKLSRDISFRGSNVDGKYLSAGESVAEVEREKQMGALIGIRKNFRDRLGAEQARLNAAQASK